MKLLGVADTVAALALPVAAGPLGWVMVSPQMLSALAPLVVAFWIVGDFLLYRRAEPGHVSVHNWIHSWPHDKPPSSERERPTVHEVEPGNVIPLRRADEG